MGLCIIDEKTAQCNVLILEGRGGPAARKGAKTELDDPDDSRAHRRHTATEGKGLASYV